LLFVFFSLWLLVSFFFSHLNLIFCFFLPVFSALFIFFCQLYLSSSWFDCGSFIADTVAQHDVVLFMKGTPDQPRCGFSSLAVQILDHLGAPFVGVDVLQDEALREGIKSFTDWPTIPQLYVKGEFVGGSDIVREMFQSGELQALMAEKGVAQDGNSVEA
jgi:monothiol glutaredoxin